MGNASAFPFLMEVRLNLLARPVEVKQSLRAAHT